MAKSLHVHARDLIHHANAQVLDDDELATAETRCAFSSFVIARVEDRVPSVVGYVSVWSPLWNTSARAPLLASLTSMTRPGNSWVLATRF